MLGEDLQPIVLRTADTKSLAAPALERVLDRAIGRSTSGDERDAAELDQRLAEIALAQGSRWTLDDEAVVNGGGAKPAGAGLAVASGSPRSRDDSATDLDRVRARCQQRDRRCSTSLPRACARQTGSHSPLLAFLACSYLA